MAEHVKLWDPEALVLVDSTRLYTVHETTEKYYGYDGPETSPLYLYEDDSTGLVTTDVAKFERLMSLILKK
jgi:hypothetical protein